MLASDLVEVLCAAHLGRMVEAPFVERGGIMVVGPPGVLKTTFVSVLDKHYQDSVMLSDINVKSLVAMREVIAAGKINTLVLPELGKVYERAEVTSQNVEGTIRALAAEGFAAASFEDARVNRLTARALVLAAMTPSLVDKKFVSWEETGFNRRFLWSLVRLKDSDALENAAVAWERIDFRLKHVPLPPLNGRFIPNETTERERRRMAVLVKYQNGGDHAIQIQLMVRILAVLKWWYRESGDMGSALDTVERFAVSLGKNGDSIEIPAVSDAEQGRRRREASQAEAATAASALARRRWDKPTKRKRKFPKVKRK